MWRNPCGGPRSCIRHGIQRTRRSDSGKRWGRGPWTCHRSRHCRGTSWRDFRGEPREQLHVHRSSSIAPAGHNFVRILVTGAAGFVGSHIVDALIEDGHEVVAIDSLTESVHSEPPQYLNPAARFVAADLRDSGALDPWIRDVDAVSHQAAMVGLEPSFSDAPDYVSHNGVGTAALLSSLDTAGFAGHLVLASSMVVYGEGAYECSEHGDVRIPPRRAEDLKAGRYDPPCPHCGKVLQPAVVEEDRPVDPRNVYAATK